MKLLKDIIIEKLVINNNSKIKNNNDNDFYAVLGTFEAKDDLETEFADAKISCDYGMGPSIFILPYKELKSFDKQYIEEEKITIFEIPEKYKDKLNKFEKDYYHGKIHAYELKEVDDNFLKQLYGNLNKSI